MLGIPNPGFFAKPGFRVWQATKPGFWVGFGFGKMATVYKYKKAVLPQGNRAMPQVFFSVEVRQHYQHSLQV